MPAKKAGEQPKDSSQAVPATRPPERQQSAGGAASGSDAQAAKRPRLSQKPVLPDQESGCLGAKSVMKKIIPWVIERMHEELADSVPEIGKLKDVTAAAPLKIADTKVTSFKETWNPANCHLSCSQSGIYEAGGSLFWMDPELNDFHLPAEEPSWSWVFEAASSHFIAFLHKDNLRILFPVPLRGFLKRNTMFAKTEMPHAGSLTPLTGHAFIYAWYAAAFMAMEKNDKARLVQLYECALTVTITMFVDVDESTLLVESIRGAEIMRAASKVLVDNFIVFSKKLFRAFQKIDVKQLQSKDIKFQGGLMNTTMAKTVEHVKKCLNDKIDKQYGDLDREYGQEVLTGSYNKVRLLLLAVKQDTDVLEWTLDAMMTALRRSEVTVDDFKVDRYQKKNGEPNFVQHAVACRAIAMHLSSVADSILKVDEPLGRKLKDNVVDKLFWPSSFNEAFPVEMGKDEGHSGDEASGRQDFLDKLIQDNNPRGVILFAELFKKLHSGEYYEVISNIALETNIAEMLQSLDSESLGPLRDDMKEMMKMLHAAESVVSSKACGQAPMPTLRNLVRQHSDGADAEAAKAERQDVWKRAVAQRKKFVTLAQVKNPRARASYQEVLKKHLSFSNYSGNPPLKHRVFTFSAELIHQKGKQPWLEASVPPDGGIMEEILQFMVNSCRGPADVVMAWDGCMKRTVRRSLEDTIGGLSCCAEVNIVYSSSWNSWIKKKLLYTSENMETGYVSMPVGRNKIGVQKRVGGSGSAGSEESTHWTTMSAVALPARTSLARIDTADKEKIFTEKPGDLPKKWTDLVSGGVPLYWQECKSLPVWVQLMTDVKADVVVDLSPGSGILATACMQLGIPYLGIVSSTTHMSWLTNVLDRAALQYIVQSGHVLYQDDLATLVKDMFADLLEQDDTNCQLESEEEQQNDDCAEKES